jgi:hypothetical protein
LRVANGNITLNITSIPINEKSWYILQY